MVNIEIPDGLLQLQRAANAAHREATAGGYSPGAWRPWLDASEAVQRAVTERAAATAGVSRYELEMAVKAAAREADEATA
ncbi:hypothetical protein GCM10011583_66050 [Streptomyces camponoticapitis]|uniref:Uncharacterized protein n=1 Tax=Streptomyces camponoticapitis TaxID=1616125 RepID=A0ABQ2ESW3_9ACTN|nr:hypothetical protein [Streptomyces camponoticapitis]GGK24775.1 hypothetical protein GCM10011583_66050 [Streptomyces camponoticapitis]